MCTCKKWHAGDMLRECLTLKVTWKGIGKCHVSPCRLARTPEYETELSRPPDSIYVRLNLPGTKNGNSWQLC